MAAAPEPDEPEFVVVHKSTANGIHPVTKYRSKTTGLLLYHAEVRGPTVSGYIVVGTFPADDDGLPHCLEHMIFLGSEKYPYKGVLDILAGKCLSNGTNAYTDSDHTCYTLETAGQNGFCCLLPIYLDHVFLPTLEEIGFAAEVHAYKNREHQGVVYSEQQAKEGDIEVVSQYELCRALYPQESGYHYVSGGVLRNLRNSCNITKVRDCHKKFYSTKNACVIVCGIVEHEKLFQCMQPFIDDYRKKKGEPVEVPKEWNHAIPQLKESVIQTVQVPSEASDEVYMTIGFRGPSVVRNPDETVAMKILLNYLADTSVSPLQVEFVEHDRPQCSSLSQGEIENSEVAYFFEFEEVPLEETVDMPARLRLLVEQEMHGLDMARMKDCIENHMGEVLSNMENNPANSIAYSCITDFLYGGGSGAMFDTRLNISGLCREFFKYTRKDWGRLVQKYILDQNWATIIAIPVDQTAPPTTSSNSKAAVKSKSSGLGKSIRAQQKEVPPKVMAAIAVPATRSIDFHTINREIDPMFAKNFACNVVFDDIDSQFVYATFHMDTTALLPEHRKYLGLYVQSFTESEMIGDDGHVIEYEDIVIGMAKNLLNLNCFFGINHVTPFTCGDFNHILTVNAQFEIDKADLGFKWLRRVLFKIHWTGERLQIMTSKLISEMNQIKRKGQRIARAAVHDAIFKEDSNSGCLILVRQQMFLRELRRKLPGKEASIIKTLKEIQEILTDPANVTLQIASSKNRLGTAMAKKNTSVREILRSMFPVSTVRGSEKRFKNTPDKVWMKDLTQTLPQAYLIGITTEECGYLYQVCPSISDFNDTDYPILCTAIQYFIQVEGPFFRAVRGGGYAYDFYMFSNPPKGVLVFQLSKCASTIGAYRACRETIRTHTASAAPWNEDLLESAKSSHISDIVMAEATPQGLARRALTSCYHNVPLTFAREQIDRIDAVTLDEVRRVTKDYLEPMFEKPTNCAIVVPRERLERVAADFKKIGKPLTLLPPLLEDSILGEWKF